MRKRLKLKKHSCAMCKPHKMHGANRWKPKDEVALSEWEAEQNEHTGVMKEETVRESCCVAENDCENPAGWGSGYGIAINTHLKKIPLCGSCGYAVCEKCSDIVEYNGKKQRICKNCQRDNERYAARTK